MSKIEEIIIINPYGIADTVGKITTTSATSLRLFNCIQRTGQYAFQIWIRSVENLQPGNPVKIDINGDITSEDLTMEWKQIVVQGKIDIINQDFIDIHFPQGSFYVYEAQFEYGNRPSDWKPSVRENLSMIQQTAKMISLLVESDDEKSEIILTDKMIQAITKQFVIKSPDGSRTVITGGKISTDLVQSNDYEYTNGIYSNKGTMIGLENTGFIRSKNFAVDKDGNAYFKGNITATSGYIGSKVQGFSISEKAIFNGKSSLDDSSNGIYIGTDGICLGADGKYCTLLSNGNTKFNSGTIGPWNIESSSIWKGNNVFGNAGGIYFGNNGLSISNNFKVAPDGTMTANNGIFSGILNGATGSFSGNITATSGTIGGFIINSNQIYNSTGGSGNYVGMSKYNGGYAFYAGATDQSNSSLAKFRVGHNGILRCSDGSENKYVEINSGQLTIHQGETHMWIKPNEFRLGNSNSELYWNGAQTLEFSGYMNLSGSLTVNTNIWMKGGNIYPKDGDTTKYINSSGNARLGYLTMDGNINMQAHSIQFSLGNGIKYGDSEWILRPYKSGDYNVTALGNGNRRTVLYGTQVRLNSSTGTTVTSDRRLKKDFVSFDERYEKFFMSLKPTTYVMAYKKNAEEYKRTNGFIAQDVEKALINANINPEELDLISCDTADKEFLNDMFNGHPPDIKKQYSLNYNNFIAINTHMIQKNRKDLIYQSGMIDMQQAIINDLQSRLWQAEKEIKELKQAAQ